MTDPIRRRLRDRPQVTDLVVALSCLVFSLPGTLALAYQRHLSITTSLVLLAISCLPLTVRSRWPLPVVGATVLVGELSFALTSTLGPVPGAALFALYAVAVRTDRRTAWRTGAGAAAVLLIAALAFRPGLAPLPENLGVLAWCAAAVALGDAIRSRRELLASLQERAERAERTREEVAQRRVTEERIRIARELHDVVAHHITLVNAQAGVAHHLMRTDPEHAYQALERIRDTSRSALDELRATVGLLRGRDDQDEPREPTPGLADLDTLLDSFRHAGLEVTLDRLGTTGQLPPITDLTAYRIIQEALTNTHKHAGAATALVRLEVRGDTLRVTVEDHGRPTTSPTTTATARATAGPGTGHGMIGMHERARSAGGTLDAGPRPGGGFRVHAELPLRPDRKD